LIKFIWKHPESAQQLPKLAATPGSKPSTPAMEITLVSGPDAGKILIFLAGCVLGVVRGSICW
jgi:hypothetical protein